MKGTLRQSISARDGQYSEEHHSEDQYSEEYYSGTALTGTVLGGPQVLSFWGLRML